MTLRIYIFDFASQLQLIGNAENVLQVCFDFQHTFLLLLSNGTQKGRNAFYL